MGGNVPLGYAQPRRLHPRQRLDGRPLWYSTGIFFRNRPVHAGLLSLWPVDKHPYSGCLQDNTGGRGRDDGTGRSPDPGAHLPQVRAGSGHEFRGHSRADRTHAGTRRRRLDRRLSDGVEMTNIKQVVPIGVGCRLCPWQVPLPDCAFHSKSLSVSALRR